MISNMAPIVFHDEIEALKKAEEKRTQEKIKQKSKKQKGKQL